MMITMALTEVAHEGVWTTLKRLERDLFATPPHIVLHPKPNVSAATT